MSKAKIYEQQLIIPTYAVGEEEKNPMFFEKRVYQGSSGKVYPNPVIEKIYDDKIDKAYTAVILENDYIYVIVLPELGGRIYTAYDKSNNYDFVYHNHVIKPALVGLLGPWISGGIEFNWPQHHRPSTFMPTNYKINENTDGSVSIIMGEIDNMFSLKENTEIKIYPDKSIIEINAQIYNRSDLTQTFLWWANPAFKVNDHTKTIMPPDVTAVMDHGKRAVSTFPVATGEYYKMDYSAGVDISRYKNIQVPTSFMAYKSNFDFVGAYDFEKEAGLYHYADHQISPGKKQWTWGCGDFGKAWDRNLTDNDGPYIELMTGCFTDNQPDFTFILPQEEKTFTQYFMPYKHVGNIKNANRDFCLSLENNILKIHSTGEFKNVTVKAILKNEVMFSKTLDFTPNTVFSESNIDNNSKIVLNYNNDVLEYHCSMIEKIAVPDPATACPEPKDCKSLEELYLYGLHIEQYRHATRLSEDYYLEGLKRDDTDYRINTAYGKLLLRRGLFKDSLNYFNKAIDKLTCKNPNPVTSEAMYYKGIACMYLNDYTTAYDNFYKCIWNNENKTGAFYYLAVIAFIKKDYTKALKFVESSLQFNTHNMKSLSLKGNILLAISQTEKADKCFKQALELDKLDLLAKFELSIINNTVCQELKTSLPLEIINLSADYITAENYIKAKLLIECFTKESGICHPLAMYYLAYVNDKLGLTLDRDKAIQNAVLNADIICFPNRLFDIIVLNRILELDKNDYLANYYLGNLFYDKRQYQIASKYWLESEKNNSNFATVKRNLALYYFNKCKQQEKAVKYLENAFSLDKTDSRILMELIQLYQLIGKPVQELKRIMLENMNTVVVRDDLYLEYISTENETGNSALAEKLIENRHFHPWEGGEGKVTKLYKNIKCKLAEQEIENSNFENALNKLTQALIFPENLGEGKLILDYDNDIHYKLGEVYDLIGNSTKAEQEYTLATRGNMNVADDMYYNDNPIEYLYYMALAYKKLGNLEHAVSIKNAFREYYNKHIYKDPVIDYFAVSLPDMLIWEQNIKAKTVAFCNYLLELSDKI